MLPLEWGVHLRFFVGVAAADVEVDVVAGVVRFGPRDGSPVPTRLESGAR